MSVALLAVLLSQVPGPQPLSPASVVVELQGTRQDDGVYRLAKLADSRLAYHHGLSGYEQPVALYVFVNPQNPQTGNYLQARYQYATSSWHFRLVGGMSYQPEFIGPPANMVAPDGATASFR